MSAMDAAVTLTQISGGSLTNLQIQKLLYLGQMFHLGRHQMPIFADDFEAWKLGPVVPGVYRAAKIYGGRPVKTLFQGHALQEGTGKAILEEMYQEIPDHRPWKLVAITHWEHGAWAKNYRGDGHGDIISKSDILDEFRTREADAAARQQRAA